MRNKTIPPADAVRDRQLELMERWTTVVIEALEGDLILSDDEIAVLSLYAEIQISKLTPIGEC